MPAPLPVPMRLLICRRAEQGQSAATIASAMGLSVRTVRHLLRRQRMGAKSLSACYDKCGRVQTSHARTIREKVVALRREHPTWGSELIRVILRCHHRFKHIPTARTLQRWLVAEGFGRPAKGRRPKSETPRAQKPHEVWQIDASEQIRLASQQRVSWLRIVDECTGAVLETKVYPQRRWLQVGCHAVQKELRRAFRRWGRPFGIRVDNGGPWGAPGELPPDLALWLLGLGIDVHWNDPHQPQQNGIVERSQGTGKNWAEPQKCLSPEQLQRHLKRFDAIQRQEYPSIDHQSRLVVHPDLQHSGRNYSRSWEDSHWDHGRVLDHLATYLLTRKVDKNGKVSLYHRPHYVGSLHVGKQVYVMIDPQRLEWVFSDAVGRQLRTQPADELTAQRIKSLTVTARKSPEKP